MDWNQKPVVEISCSTLERCRLDTVALTAGADKKCRGVERRKGLRGYEDPVVGRSIARKIDDGIGRRAVAGDRDQKRWGVAFAGAGLGRIDIVDHGEVGSFRAVGNLDPHRRAGDIAGETDVAVCLPGEGGYLDRCARDLDAGPGATPKLSAREQGGLILLWFAFVIVAPAGEEMLFRGFLYRGWASATRTAWPAILVIAAVWAGFHIQYDWFGILQVFLVGLLFGWIRWRSGSTALTIFLHGLLNAWATLQTAVKVEWLT